MSAKNQPGLTLWHNETRELRTGNIGAARGDHHWGTIHGAGLYFIVGEKGGGKTSLLSLLAKLHQDNADFSNVITVGESEGYVELSPMCAVFRRGPLGEIRDPEILHTDEVPPLDLLSPAILTLIDGGGRKGTEERARARLGALLKYCPVDSTPDRLWKLFQTLEGRMWTDDIGEGPGEGLSLLVGGAWEGLVKALPKAPKRVEPFRRAAEFRFDVQSLPGRDGSLLTDHRLLTELLNATGLCAERAHEHQLREVSAVRARLTEIVSGAARSTELPEARLLTLLKADHEKSELAHALELARLAEREVQTERAARIAEIERRAQLQKSHGDRPDADRSELEAAVEAGARCAQAEQHARGELAVLAAVAAQDGERRAEAAKRAKAAAVRWRKFHEELVEACNRGSDWAFNANLSTFAEKAPGLIEGLEAALVYTEHDRAAELAAAQKAVEDAQEKSEQADAEIDAARARHGAAIVAAERWDEVDALLGEELEGPGDVDVTAAAGAVEEAKRAVAVAGHALAYRAASADLAASVDLATGLEVAGKDYRKAAQESWGFLSLELNDAIALPWVQVDQGKIFLGYGADRKLNDDPEVLRAARLQAEQDLTRRSDTVLPLARFILEEIRRSPAVEWRDIDSGIWVSTCELHEAAMSVWLSRRRQIRGIPTIPWEVMAAFDEASLLAFSERVREADLVVISERPRRKGDPEELFLEKVELPALNGDEPAERQNDWESARAGA